ncbi:MAG: metal-dependent transcriptional regulator [Sphaerochaetaceae bacterium]
MRESGEDYLETVLKLSLEDPKVRLTDVANHLGVSKPSASRAMKNLQALGYIDQESYGAIELTAKGYIRASQIYKRHKTLRTFLEKVLGIDSETAEADACRMEHILSNHTMEKLSEFVEEHTNE